MTEYIGRASLMGKLTSSEVQKLMREMDGCQAYGYFVALLNSEPAADVVDVAHRSMLVKDTTDDFEDKELARIRGWHRKYYCCPSCNSELRRETYEKDRCFGSWQAVDAGIPMNHCPNCGTKIGGRGIQNDCH